MARPGSTRSVGEALPDLTAAVSGSWHVGDIQRMRILDAMAEVAHEHGAGDISVAHVVERAGVSRRTFYQLFEDLEDCLLAALREAIARATRYASDVYDPALPWAERTRDGLVGLLDFLEREPALGCLAVVGSLGGGARALELRCATLERVALAIDEGRECMNGSSSATPLTAEGVVGGVVSVIYGRLVSNDRGLMVDLVNPLMSMIVLPYLGPVAARKQLERPLANHCAHISQASANPLKDLDMRLTYRTVRALVAVAASPGSSNRSIGEASGIGDQGQVSKLLARLEKLGLVQNTRVGPLKGATNTWRLTERGEEVAGVITARAATS